jgi:hypothetical protein
LENCGAFFPSLGKKSVRFLVARFAPSNAWKKPLVPVSNAWKRCNWVAQGCRPSMFDVGCSAFDVRFSGFGFAGSETRPTLLRLGGFRGVGKPRPQKQQRLGFLWAGAPAPANVYGCGTWVASVPYDLFGTQPTNDN